MDSQQDPLALQRVMHVEDDPDIRNIARIALERIGGWQVVSCASAADALALFEAFAPDLILLDVMMPGMDGPALLADIRARERGVPVAAIFVTARVRESESRAFRQLGAIGVIHKPFKPSELVDAIRALWAARLAAQP